MPRTPRREVEGGVHHVYARGNGQQDIYLDDADRWRYLSILHLLLETPETNLGSGMQRLHGRYGQQFNERHRRCGHVFQGRYGTVPIESDEQLWSYFGGAGGASRARYADFVAS